LHRDPSPPPPVTTASTAVSPRSHVEADPTSSGNTR
jgi:hypothetical protein